MTEPGPIEELRQQVDTLRAGLAERDVYLAGRLSTLEAEVARLRAQVEAMGASARRPRKK